MFAIIDNSTKITFMHIIIFILYNYLDMKIVSQRAETFSWLLKCTAKLLFKMTVIIYNANSTLCAPSFSAAFISLGFIILKCSFNSMGISGTSLMI